MIAHLTPGSASLKLGCGYHHHAGIALAQMEGAMFRKGVIHDIMDVESAWQSFAP